MISEGAKKMEKKDEAGPVAGPVIMAIDQPVRGQGVPYWSNLHEALAAFYGEHAYDQNEDATIKAVRDFLTTQSGLWLAEAVHGVPPALPSAPPSSEGPDNLTVSLRALQPFTHLEGSTPPPSLDLEEMAREMEREADCYTDDFDASIKMREWARRLRSSQGSASPAVDLEEAIRIIESEPECPDEMPDEMLAYLQAGGREAYTNALRITVRVTKEAIARRLREGAK
jgi:hypothetical protein